MKVPKKAGVEQTRENLHRWSSAREEVERISVDDRPGFLATLLPHLQALRSRTARPHWLVIDEAHHMLPSSWSAANSASPQILESTILITVHPDRIAKAALGVIEILVAIGKAPFEVLESFAKQVEISPPPGDSRDLATGEGLVWFPKTGEMPIHIKTVQGSQERRRHIRNYAVGELSPEQSFYFRGPDSKLNLRAQNLQTFLQLAEGVDETWMHHLHKGDYSAWFKLMIKDDELGRQAAEIEQTKSASAEETRRKIKEAVESRYTAPD